jgi:hypothetical protein
MADVQAAQNERLEEARPAEGFRVPRLLANTDDGKM